MLNNNLNHDVIKQIEGILIMANEVQPAQAEEEKAPGADIVARDIIEQKRIEKELTEARVFAERKTKPKKPP